MISEIGWQGKLYRLMASRSFPEDYQADWIYYQPDFLRMQPGEPFLFQLLDEKGTVMVRMVFVGEGESASSLPQAPFGGIQLIYILPAGLLEVFIDYCCETLSRWKFREINLIQPSPVYQEAGLGLIMESLKKSDFLQVKALANYHIEVANTPPHKLSKSAKIAIKKCQKEGFAYHHRIPFESWVYDFISEAYRERGYRISLREVQLVRFFHTFPDDYWVCAVFDGQKPVALTVVVKVNEAVLYTFYIAYDTSYSGFSPSKFLIQKLSERAGLEGFTILDLGLVSDQGKHLPGLEKFKLLVGGVRSFKYYFSKILK